MTRCVQVALVALAAAAFCAPSAQAHKLNLFATVEGDTVKGMVYFPTGDGARGLEVTVVNGTGEAVATVTTDEAGEFTYTPPSPGEYVFVAETADGHRAEYRVGADESGATSPVAVVAKTPTSADAGDLAQVVARAVAQELQPFREQFERAQSRARLLDIAGGIGYIVGLAGVLFFVKARRETKGQYRGRRSGVAGTHADQPD